MRENKRETGEVVTTIWPFQPNSCMACWNMPLTSDDGQNAPRAHGIIASIPVHLVEKNGKTTIVCYVARCMNCGHIQSYGARNGIFKMPISKPNFDIALWPEIVRNDIDPLDFEEAVLRSKSWNIYLDARNGLKEPPIPENVKELWEGFLKRTGGKECWGF